MSEQTHIDISLVRCGGPGGAWLVTVDQDYGDWTGHNARTTLTHAKRWATDHVAEITGGKRKRLRWTQVGGSATMWSAVVEVTYD